jgi:hypothetical protein
MSYINEELWPATEPPRDFSVSTVERMLITHSPAASGVGRRHMVWLLVAAVFVSGVALGVGGLGARSRCIPQLRTTTSAISVSSPSPQSPISPSSQVPQNERKMNVRSVHRAPSRRVVSPVAAPSASSSGTSVQPRVPPCRCERGYADFMCDCY